MNDDRNSRRGPAENSAASDQSTERPEHEQESGEPGGGRGRRDEVGGSGVYPPGVSDIPPDAEVRMAGSWGGGDYNESGGSELVYRDGQLLGGLTAGKDGEPTIDIHDGRSSRGDQPADGRAERTGRDETTVGDEPTSPTGLGAEAVDRDALRLRGLPPGQRQQHDDRPADT